MLEIGDDADDKEKEIFSILVVVEKEKCNKFMTN